MPPKICLTEFMHRRTGEAILAAIPGAQFLLLNEKGDLLAGSPEEVNALFVTHDLVAAAEGNPKVYQATVALAARADWVQVTWAGLDAPLFQELLANARRLAHGGGLHAKPIAHYVIAQMLRFIRRMDEHAENQRQRRWAPREGDEELTGKTLGIAGLGGIGQEIARLGQAFEMRVLGTRQSTQDCPYADETLPAQAFPRLLQESDFLVLALPDTPDTRNLLSRDQFRRMKDSAMLLNVGRGSAIDEAALANALQEGEIACAAIDIMQTEPLPQESPLWKLPNCYINPHDARSSRLALSRYTERFCENLRRFQAGQPLISEVPTGVVAEQL